MLASQCGVGQNVSRINRERSVKSKRPIVSLLVIVLWLICDHYSVRLALVTHGYPFADIVPKAKIGIHIFDYFDSDLMQASALVFTHGRLVGWVYSADIWGAVDYVPYDGTRQFNDPLPI